MTIREHIEKKNFAERMLALAAITGDNSYLGKLEGDVPPEQRERDLRFLATHISIAGPRAFEMAIAAGKAIKASTEYPIKPKRGPAQWFKDKVKGMFA